MSLSKKTKKWLANNANISLEGKTAIVTGANSGIGYKTAETLAYLGADVVLACRDPQRAEAARSALAEEYPNCGISVMRLDVADFASVDAFAAEIAGQGRDIDIFVNNAGVFHQPDKKTKDGFELVIGTNYIGVYYLTEKLLPYLSELPHPVAYINTISIIHKIAKLEYGDFYCEKKYSDLKVYSRSKICLAKYSYYKAKQLEGSNLHICMNHPGIAITPLGLNFVGPKLAKLAKPVGHLFNSSEKSSLSVAYIASRAVPAGGIVGPNKLFGGWGYPKANRVRRKVKTGAEELIAFTEKEIAAHR